ncbi:Zinc fingers and homeoboxes protein 3 [Liparis tanakae]|uniref:Zinc fingers and homeoboxes protein 3 n=1 Tax=Liparis tanakae TaxID=230148 RepID=A0A4Z2GIJ0_9TELE|nr:Zinc fingers and homeoboxes protein 3 [Liparis tanakae]
MIPSKSKHVREEIILGSLPELLPTIPEDSILSISGEESGHFSHGSSKSDCGGELQKGGAYSCPKCRFESRDLNYFLDHMHNCHLDFRAQPTFYCLNCGVSVVRFEALALHNATAHPKIMEGLVTASLTVNKRDGVTTVEQSLFTDNGEVYKESGISLSKTPIAKMMKAKGEHKKIVVSHTVEVRKIDTGKEVDPSMLTNVPELLNGALSLSGAPAMPRTAVAHVTTTTVSNQVFHQHTPSLYAQPSSGSNKDLPKVMIPLSSIPTYDAAMDTSSFLKTSFCKFPYPTKAELCYLTVVSEFPEEQIKLWFTAQRLKQGISWSPEEIEEARRKMFNTVFQGGAPQKQPAAQRHVNHIVSHHTVHAGSKGPIFPMAKAPFGAMRTGPGGIVTTQASMSTNPNVTRVSKSPTESTSTTVIAKGSLSILDEGKCNQDFPIKGMSILQQLIKDEDPFAGDRSGPEMKMDPVKINFKRPKLTDQDTPREIVHQDNKPGTTEVSTPQPSFSPPWANKTPQQLHTLRQVFYNTRWPSSQQYEDLSAQTGLAKPEVVRWFSDSRYSNKNGHLKWLDAYQRAPAGTEDAKNPGDAGAESPKNSPAAKKKLVERDMNKHLEGDAGLNSGQRVVWQDSYSPLLGLMGSEGMGERGRAQESAQPGVLQDPWSESAEDHHHHHHHHHHHQQPVASQSLIEQADANQARYFSQNAQITKCDRSSLK